MERMILYLVCGLEFIVAHAASLTAGVFIAAAALCAAKMFWDERRFTK